ncbi:MAG: hypothetical protein M1817_001831 [Caeruleum heppii]|nr:MAG: hypothetical protein M1817_001831 [Caeruleum heppii]
MAKYRFQWDNQDVEVLDLNPYTVTIDLSASFDVEYLPIIKQQKKNVAQQVPVVNRFGLWSDKTQNAIYIQGGHFYDAPGWNESEYHVSKPNIPPYSIWKLDLSSGVWNKEYEDETVNRTVGGAPVSIPEQDVSYYIGGLTTERTSKDTANDTFYSQATMLSYNHSTLTLDSEDIYDEDEAYGYWHGMLKHLPIGGGKGFLISMLAERWPLQTPLGDVSGEEETAEEVLFDSIMMYDIEKRRWYNQSTSFIRNEKPDPRTRFCGELVYGEQYQTWELWIYGGQRIRNESLGVDDIWVLSMPSFIWTRISVPLSSGTTGTRGHTCHAIGNQMLVVGGWPPGATVSPTAPCDRQLVKVFDFTLLTWVRQFTIGTIYKTPSPIITNAELDTLNRRAPYRTSWSADLQAAFEYEDDQGKKVSKGTIAGAVIGGVLGVVVLALGVWWLTKRMKARKARQQAAKAQGPVTGMHQAGGHSVPELD